MNEAYNKLQCVYCLAVFVHSSDEIKFLLKLKVVSDIFNPNTIVTSNRSKITTTKYSNNNIMMEIDVTSMKTHVHKCCNVINLLYRNFQTSCLVAERRP